MNWIDGKAHRYGLGLLGFIIVLLIWQISIWLFDPPSFLLPSPRRVVERAWDLRAVWPEHVWSTVEGTLSGFAIALLAGLILGIAIVQSRVANTILTPPLVVLQIVPKIALAPIVLVWVGIGWSARVTIVALVAFFPIVINTIAGLQATQPELMDLARITRMSRLKTLLKIRLPGALPQIFAGLKVTATLAVIGIIIAEFIASERGLGYLILAAGGNLDTALQFAALILVTLFGLLLYGAIVLVEKLLVPWHTAEVALVQGLG